MARVKGKREKPAKHKGLKTLLKLVALLLVIVLAYVTYVFISYYRLDDKLSLEVNNPDSVEQVVPVGEELSLQSWNIGFAAYLQDFSFFMDGGKESRARSEELVYSNMDNITTELKNLSADFYAIQEVDVDSTRTYHVDESELIKKEFEEYSNTFAQNYDSPYLFWPLIKPHGASKSGLLTMSKYEMESSLRRSLPIQTDVAKLIDLDRCYDIVKYPTADGKEFVLINFHLSAYTTDPTIADQQLEMLYGDIKDEYAKGNYVICVGDFNKDLLGNSAEAFGNKESREWAKAFKEDKLPEGFSLVKAFDKSNPVPSCRDCDIPYDKDESFKTLIDGFIKSDNIELTSAKVIDTEFMWSDHNPVRMTFKLSK